MERILGFALRDSLVLDQLGDALRSDLVTPNPLHRRIIEFADDFYLEKGKLAQTGDFELWIASLTEQQKGGVGEALTHLLQEDISEFDPEHFSERVIAQLRAKATKTALARLNSVQEVTPETFRELTDRVEGISSGAVTGLATLSDLDSWAHPPPADELVPTGFGPLDRMIGGFGQELWIVFADSGMGKSMLLQNFAATAAQKGNRVLHITLELGLRPLILRYYRQIAKRENAAFVRAMPETRKRLEHWFRFAKGEVYLLEYPAYSMDPRTLQKIISRVDRLHGPLGMIVIDYLDLMTLPQGMRSQGGYEDLGKITHLMRGYCPAFGLPVLTASQAVRKPERQGRLTVRDMGDSYNKVRGADGLLAFNQTDEEKEEHQGRIGVLKSRDSGGSGEFSVYINRELALIADLANQNTIKLMGELGHLPAPPTLLNPQTGEILE